MKLILLKDLMNEATAGEEARQRGLKSIGFGRYTDPTTGKVVAKSENGKLVNVSPTTGTAPAAAPHTSHDSPQGAWDNMSPREQDNVKGMVDNVIRNAARMNMQGSLYDTADRIIAKQYGSTSDPNQKRLLRAAMFYLKQAYD